MYTVLIRTSVCTCVQLGCQAVGHAYGSVFLHNDAFFCFFKRALPLLRMQLALPRSVYKAMLQATLQVYS